MQAITINVQISKCPRQYECVRLGGEWTVESGETPESVMARALEILNAFYEESQRGTKAVEQKVEQRVEPKVEQKVEQKAVEPIIKTPLTMSDTKTLNAICRRIEVGVKLEQVLEYYEPDDEALAVLKLASKL